MICKDPLFSYVIAYIVVMADISCS